jgi:hypothetical protein
MAINFKDGVILGLWLQNNIREELMADNTNYRGGQ